MGKRVKIREGDMVRIPIWEVVGLVTELVERDDDNRNTAGRLPKNRAAMVTFQKWGKVQSRIISGDHIELV